MGACDRGQEPPPWGHRDEGLPLLTLLLFLAFLSRGGVGSISEHISFDLPLFFFLYVLSVLSVTLTAGDYE